jgi:hypothetical protein
MQELEIEAPKKQRENRCNSVSPSDMVCLRNTCMDTLHKRDDDNNNNNLKQVMRVR